MGGKKVIDTSPKIAEHGKSLDRSNDGIKDDVNWSYTEWYLFSPQKVGIVVIYDNQSTSGHPYQYNIEDGTKKDWFYADDTGSRRIGWLGAALYRIRFSVRISQFDDAYAFCNNTGQIFFAGKNTPYYGYTNINDMPT